MGGADRVGEQRNRLGLVTVHNDTATRAAGHHADVHDAFVMPRPVTVEQVRAAAQALGVTLDTTVVAGGQRDREVVCSQDQEATLPLAILDALIVRWQLDQDLRHPMHSSSRALTARCAQAMVAGDSGDGLAAALRRLQTVAGLVGGLPQDDEGATPGPAIEALVAAASDLLAAWITSCALEQPALRVQCGDAAAMLDEHTVRKLAVRAEQHLTAGVDAFQTWRTSRGLP